MPKFTLTAKRRRAVGAFVLSALALCLSLLVGAPTAQAYATGQFAANMRWDGEFADPAVIRVGNTYYAYATVTGGDNLPVAHSTDLYTWYARGAYPAGANPGWWPGYNDALPHTARYASYGLYRNGHYFTSPWAPSVAHIGTHYVEAYSIPMAWNPARRCISVATSASPIGPFVDSTTGPLMCSTDPRGSNDPFLFTVGTQSFLMWKNAGVPGSAPTRLWSRQLNSAGTGFAVGSYAHPLLTTAMAWENNVIENPSMILYAGRYYLFYSANNYDTADYAIGYAICRSAIGPCYRPPNVRILGTGGSIAGPGGPAPITGVLGSLRLGYAAWDAGHVGYANPANHRRMHFARLAVNYNGTLSVVTRA